MQLSHVQAYKQCCSAGSGLNDCHAQKLLTRLCTFLTVHGHLTSCHLLTISSFSRLTCLSIAADDAYETEALELPACLTSLLHIKSLEALNFPQIPTAYANLSRLTSLAIAPISLIPQDLQAFTQLQHLTIGPLWGTLATPVLLPKGSHVSLQHLNAASECAMSNLAELTSLTYLELQLEPTDNRSWEWPTSLPNLETLHMRYPAEQFGRRGESINRLPAEWANYTKLKSMMLPPFEPWQTHELPEWFADLRRLTRLDSPGAAVIYFRYGIADISQLHHLDLRSWDSPITREMLAFASMPYLTYLSFADLGPDKWNGTGHGEEPSHEDICWLDRLASAILTRQAQHRQLFRINVSRCWYEWQARPTSVLGLPTL